MVRFILVAKNGKNRRNYDLITNVTDVVCKRLKDIPVLDPKHNINSKKLKDYLLTEGYKLVVSKLKKKDKEKLASCRFIRDILSELNALNMRYNSGVFFVTLPQGSLFNPL